MWTVIVIVGVILIVIVIKIGEPLKAAALEAKGVGDWCNRQEAQQRNFLHFSEKLLRQFLLETPAWNWILKIETILSFFQTFLLENYSLKLNIETWNYWI